MKKLILLLVFALPFGAHAANSIGVSTKCAASGSNTTSCPLNGTTAASTILVFAYSQNSSNVTAVAISDGTNGSYPCVGSFLHDPGPQGGGQLCYFQNNAGGNLTLSVTFTSSSGTGNITVGVVEVPGASTSGGLAQSNSKTASTSLPITAPTVTTTSAGEMVVSMAYGLITGSPTALLDNATGAAPSSGWAILSNTVNLPAGGMSYQLMSSTGTYNDSFNATGGSNAYFVMYTVGLAAAAAGPTSFAQMFLGQ